MIDIEDVQRVKDSGDTLAYNRIYNDLKPKMVKHITKIYGDPYEAEDIAQEALLKIYSKINRFAGKSRFSTWATKVALNEASNFYATRRRRPSKDIDIEPESSFMVDNITPEDHVVMNDRISHIENAIDDMPEGFIPCLELRYRNEDCYDAISSKTGYNIGTVRSRIHRGRARMTCDLTGE